MLLDGVKIMGHETVGPMNFDFDLILDKIKNQKAAFIIATKCLRSGESHSGRPHVAGAIDHTIAVLMRPSAVRQPPDC